MRFVVQCCRRDVVPIVMGGRPLDYLRASPDHSFIHVEDFPSVKALAEYLHLLDRNETLYNEYLRWKGSGEFINTYFWCRLCAMLHAPPLPKVGADGVTRAMTVPCSHLRYKFTRLTKLLIRYADGA